MTIQENQKQIISELGYTINRLSEQLETLQGEIEMTYKYYAGFGARKDLTTTEMLNYILKTVPNTKPKKFENDFEDTNHYIKALEEISKNNRKAETCKLIALKALGQLHDEDYQPELLTEENLRLRMELEDMESKLSDSILKKVFPEEKNHPLMTCKDCGEYYDYHHEEHCPAKKYFNMHIEQ